MNQKKRYLFLYLKGDFDKNNYEELDKILSYSMMKQSRIVFDFSKLSLLDKQALNILVKYIYILDNINSSIFFVGLNDDLINDFYKTGVFDTMKRLVERRQKNKKTACCDNS